MPTAPDPTNVIKFEALLDAETRYIDARRGALDRPPLIVDGSDTAGPVLDVVGLALSGGGIRSAAVSLGVLQAFNEHEVLEKVDYLSTVSGGGYMGTALSATLAKTGGFVFGASTGPRGGGARPSDVKDTPAVGHLRNYSNYLVPLGARDVVTAVAIWVRGLIANVALVLPVLLAVAALTIFTNPNRDRLHEADILGVPVKFLPSGHFGITLLVALVVVPLFFAWAMYRSIGSNERRSEFGTLLPALAAGVLVLVAATAFGELQPFLLDGMFEHTTQTGSQADTSLLTSVVKKVTAIATSIAAVVTFFRQQFGNLLKSVTASSTISAKLAAAATRGAVWIAGAALPLLMLVGYLYLSFWGIYAKPKATAEPAKPAPVHWTVQIEGQGLSLHGAVDCRPGDAGLACTMPAPAAATTEAKPAAATAAAARDVTPKPTRPAGPVEHCPRWLAWAAGLVPDWLVWVAGVVPDRVIRAADLDDAAPPPGVERLSDFQQRLVLLYVGAALLLFILAYRVLSPNANSLHRLYRDRLSKAFLFDPSRPTAAKRGFVPGQEFAPLDTMRLSELGLPPVPGAPGAPYHLINAALNLQGSDYANQRGRNADFFLFSPFYVGSEATGYRQTALVEKDTSLDLPTAMAVSGAAFSSNMGGHSIRALTPTLAILNLRTGFWLGNPKYTGWTADERRTLPFRVRRSKLYLLQEITGGLSEECEEIYLTDGGHIENLGVYQLLRRRCRFIVVVDAEADPAMRLGSFIQLQRYARIDLGIRINMPWERIQASTLAWKGMGPNAASPPVASNGPHAAIGTIDYDGGKTGYLLYIKSSLAGDENDYVRDYARRHAEFPHESTGDQFFSEEQFEAYRALGFHMANRLLTGEDQLQVFGVAGPATFRSRHPTLDAFRAALGLKISVPGIPAR